jgi:hypothetical protein
LIKLEFSGEIFPKQAQISSLIEIRSVEAGVFHVDRQKEGRTDGQTDITKPIVAFSGFAKSSRKERHEERKEENKKQPDTNINKDGGVMEEQEYRSRPTRRESGKKNKVNERSS